MQQQSFWVWADSAIDIAFIVFRRKWHSVFSRRRQTLVLGVSFELRFEMISYTFFEETQFRSVLSAVSGLCLSIYLPFPNCSFRPYLFLFFSSPSCAITDRARGVKRLSLAIEQKRRAVGSGRAVGRGAWNDEAGGNTVIFFTI